MAYVQEPNFSNAIPGMGLTRAVGNKRWQKPPKHTTVEEALSFYVPRITDSKLSDNILDMLDLNIPVTTIVNSLTLSAVGEGLHTVDVGVLVSPVLMELIAYVAEASKTEYDMGVDRGENPDEPTPTELAVAVKKVNAMQPTPAEDVVPPPMEEDEEEIAGSGTAIGLMSRRI
jgi:hypothetical protein